MTDRSGHIIINFVDVVGEESPQFIKKLDDLVKTGLYGDSREEAAQVLLMSELRRLFP